MPTYSSFAVTAERPDGLIPRRTQGNFSRTPLRQAVDNLGVGEYLCVPFDHEPASALNNARSACQTEHPERRFDVYLDADLNRWLHRLPDAEVEPVS